MPDRIDEILNHVVKLQDVPERLTRIETILKERCEDHQRQIDGLQSQLDRVRQRGASNSKNGGRVDARFWAAIAAALVALATAIAALCGVKP